MSARVTASTVLPPTLRPSDADYARERYGVPEASLYLRISPDLVYAAVRSGALGHRKAQRGANGIAFSQADLDAWRAARRVDAAIVVRPPGVRIVPITQRAAAVRSDVDAPPPRRVRRFA